MNMIQVGQHIVNLDNVSYIDLYHPHYEYKTAARGRWIDRFDVQIYFTAESAEGSQQLSLTGQQAENFREFLHRERFEREGLSISYVRVIGDFIPPAPEPEPLEPEVSARTAADEDFPF